MKRSWKSHFDSVLFVDCWSDWRIRAAEKSRTQHTLEFYGRILDYTRQFHFRRAYCTPDTHPWFKQQYPEMKEYDPKTRNEHILVCGAAWHICLHAPNQTSFATVMQNNTVYSAPHLVDSWQGTDRRITTQDFDEDPIITWRRVANPSRLHRDNIRCAVIYQEANYV